MTDPKLAYIVIPVYNRKETTLNCLSHLSANGDLKNFQAVVVDDGSTDGTADTIRSKYPSVDILSGNGDLWWTGGTALGMQYAASQKAEFIFWLNDDCLPQPGTLNGMVNYMKAHPRTITAPICYAGSLQGKAQHNGFKGRAGCNTKLGEIMSVDGMSGWCVGMPSTVVAEVGLPDSNRFPHYSGDDIYTLQVTRAGYNAHLLGDLSAVLYGPVHDKLSFKGYFRPGLSPRTIFQSLFWDKKSPYRLPTRFFVMIERYGQVKGILLFATKLFTWLLVYCQLQITTWISPDSLKADT